MRLSQLEATNFRNYRNLQADLSNYSQIALIGFNAQGKSNFLEAIHMLAFASSFRTTSASDTIRWGAERAAMQARISHANGAELQLEVELHRNGKRLVKLNQQYQKRLGDYVGHLKLVFFSTRDLQMLTGAPAERRQFLDILLVQTFPRYYHLLQNYQKVLKQRNQLLKQLRATSSGQLRRSLLEQLETWDIQLSQIGGDVMARRLHVLVRLNEQIRQWHSKMSNLREDLNLKYKSCLGEAQADLLSPADFQMALAEALQRLQPVELQRGQSMIGPHRDDILFELGGRELKLFASQGQIRTSALALKFAELLHLTRKFNEPPLLLLDDVFSELDFKRQQALIEAMGIPGIQTFLTTTHLEGPVRRLFNNQSLILHVQDGQLFQGA